MNTTLRTLLFESGLTHKQFADKVGIKLSTFRAQLDKPNTIDLSFKYAKFLGVTTIKGYECGVYVELVIGYI